MRLAASALAVLVSTTLLTGCAKLGSLGSALDQYKPTVTFKKVDFGAVTWTGADADFVFSLANPNPVDVKVASFTYDLDIDGKSLVDGENNSGLQLKSQGSSQLRLPVGIVFADLVDLAQGASGADTVPFSIAGSFSFDTPVGPVAIPYRESGELPVLRTPKFSLQAARVGGISLTSQTATLEVDLGVQNTGNNSLSFADLAYQLKLSGTKVADGKVASIAGVSGGATKTVTLPVTLQLVDLGTSIVSAITNKEKIQVGVTADVDVQTALGTLPLSFSESGKLQLK